MGRAFVEFCGESHVVDEGGELRFGRDAQLEIDTNPYLHRVLGRFVDRSGHWWLDNLGTAIPLHLQDLGGPTSALLAPGTGMAIGFAEFRVSFTAGPSRYELEGAVEELELDLDLRPPPGAPRTLEWGVVELTDDQRLVLVAMCEASLRRPHGAPCEPPPNRACASRLGWSLPKFTRKLDHLCLKFARVGVGGVHGDYGLTASNRRRLVVEHSLSANLVTSADLHLLARPAPDSG
jgi:hypothetical protein